MYYKHELLPNAHGLSNQNVVNFDRSHFTLLIHLTSLDSLQLKKFLSSQSFQMGSETHPPSYTMSNVAAFTGYRAAWSEDDHSFPSVAEVGQYFSSTP
jgi:hypothetical protein